MLEHKTGPKDPFKGHNHRSQKDPIRDKKNHKDKKTDRWLQGKYIGFKSWALAMSALGVQQGSPLVTAFRHIV